MRYALLIFFSLFSLFSIPVFAAEKSEKVVPKLTQTRYATFAKFNQAMIPTITDSLINLSMFVNVDVVPKSMKKTLPGEENKYVSLANAGVNFDGHLNDWLHGHLGFAFYNTNKGQGSFHMSSITRVVRNSTLQFLDDGYLYVANFDEFPLFFQAGRMYLPFSIYDRYAIVPTLVQILSEAREDAVQVGFFDWYGLSASVYLSQGVLTNNAISTQPDLNGGIAVRAQHDFNDSVGFGGGIQLMHNMLNVNALSQSDAFFGITSPPVAPAPLAPPNMVFTRTIPGIAVQGHVRMGIVRIFADYVSALRTSPDLVLRYTTPLTKAGPVFGARPSAWDVGFAVQTHFFNKLGEFDASYQESKQSAGLYVFNASPGHPLPRSRYQLGYTMHVLKNAFVRFQWAHDLLYKLGQGDNGGQGDSVTFRFGISV